MIPSDVIAKAERALAYRVRERNRDHHAGEKSRGIKNSEREFIMWDGEGPQDTGYSLIGNSKGMELCSPHLGTEECLDLILACGREYPDTIHVGYGFNYDVSCILGDLPWRHLNCLKHFTKTMWKQYEIEYIPRKWFTVKAYGITVKIYDIVSFFATDFIGALRGNKIQTKNCWHGTDRCERKKDGTVNCICDCILCLVEKDKARRSEFLWNDIVDINVYMRYELRLGTELCDQLRTVFLDAGFDVRSWHGPGSLARIALNRHGVRDAMCISPPDVSIAAQYAFAGGRFEMFRAGHFKTEIYNADINSAYPYYTSQLPNLLRGRWRYTRNYEPSTFALWYIRYNAPMDILKPYPLFRRHDNGEVSWPNRVEGWYWNPEAELVAGDKNAKFIEGWIFDEDDPSDRPFAWITDYYHKRKALQRAGSMAEFTFKLIINSVYGQLAQRAGWDKRKNTAPRFHQLEWSGWITSACRAQVFRIAMQCGEWLISIDTDGIYSLAPFSSNVITSSQLGGWSVAIFSSGIFWQSGIYALRADMKWIKAKTRGIPKGTYTPEDMITAMNMNSPLKMSRNTFIGFGLALNGQRDKLNTWEREHHEFVFGGQGKRYHNERGCRNGTTCKSYRRDSGILETVSGMEGTRDTASGDGASESDRISQKDSSDNRGYIIHGLVPVPRRFSPKDTIRSVAHYLPWLDSNPEIAARKLGHLDLVAYDVNDIDDDDRWVLDSIEHVSVP